LSGLISADEEVLHMNLLAQRNYAEMIARKKVHGIRFQSRAFLAALR
jgi:hypothetical protein